MVKIICEHIFLKHAKIICNSKLADGKKQEIQTF